MGGQTCGASPPDETFAPAGKRAGPSAGTTVTPADNTSRSPDEAAGQHGEYPAAAALRGRAGRLVERWVPAGATRACRRPSRRVLVPLAAGVAIALGLAGFVLADEPAAEAPPPLPAAHTASGTAQSASAESSPSKAAGATGASTGSPDETPERLVVSVVGKVRKPGLVRIRAGARVADAIESAGGAPRRADLLSVNLARALVDGEQIYVGVPVPPGVGTGADDGAAGAGTESDAADDEAVALNAADQEELESLPGVGEVTAQRILEWRDEHGEFTAVEQLREVDGIGDKRFEQLRDMVSLA